MKLLYHQYPWFVIELTGLYIPPEVRTGAESRVGIGDFWGVECQCGDGDTGCLWVLCVRYVSGELATAKLCTH